MNYTNNNNKQQQTTNNNNNCYDNYNYSSNYTTLH